MAISKIKPRHASEGRSIAAVLADRIDYDKNPEKTNGGLLVTGYQCFPDTAWQEFIVSKQIYTATTGRRRAPDKDVISYLLIQSFEPGTITPEDANKLGYQMALEFTGGEHQFIVATHVDKKHIHCHIEFNSTALDCSHKFNNVKNSFIPLRKINDRICQEFGLNIIEEPQAKGKHYAEWAAEKTGKSWKARLHQTIDKVLPKVSTFNDFLEVMRQEGYEVVQGIFELKNLQDPQVEHLLPHKNGKYPERKFDWNNLFWSCSHCNGIKNQKKYDDGIIDCCKNDPELMMTFKLKDGKTEISARDEHNSMAVRTALFIYESFNLLNTGMRTYKSAMRYNELTKEMNLLYDNIEAYRKNPDSRYIQRKLKALIRRESAFAAFKRNYIRDNCKEFPQLQSYIE